MQIFKSQLIHTCKALIVLGLVFGAVENGWGQTISWANTGATTAWYTNTNWSPNTSSANWLTTNLAQFLNLGTAITSGINMGTASLSIGAIEVTSGRTRALTIGNSSGTSGTLTLNGIAVNSVSNTILRNSSTSALTLQNNETGTGKTMNIALANATENVVNVDGTGNIVISSNISGNSKILTLNANSSGDLRLSGSNTYSGGTNIKGTSTGKLRIDAVSSLPTTGTVTVSTGGRLTLNIAGTYGGTTQSLTLNPTQTANPALDILSDAAVTWQGTVSINANSRIEANGATSGLLTFSGNMSGAGTLVKQAAGTLVLSGTGNSLTGDTQIGNGSLTVNSGSSMGTGGLNMYQTSTNNTTLNLNNASQTFSSLISYWTATTGTQTQTINLGSGHTLTINQSANTTFGTGAVSTLRSIIAGSGNLVKSGTGILNLTSDNSYSGSTTINAGEIRMAPAAADQTLGSLILGGGTFGTTGIPSSRTLNFSTLGLTDNSTITLDASSDHSIKFAVSSGVSWTSGKTITINNWQGTASSSGTKGKIFIGSASGTLTASQLSQINFTGFYGTPIILSTGELVPFSSTCVTPTVQSSVASSNNITSAAANVSFTRGNGTGGVIILAKVGSSSPSATPVSGTSYTANADITNAGSSTIGDAKVVYLGAANGASVASGNIPITGLSESTLYSFYAYEFNTSGTCFNIASPASNSFTTLCAMPSDVSGLSASSGNAQSTVSWTNGSCLDEVIIVAHTSSIGGTPTGTYASNSLSYTDAGNPNFPGGGKVVYNGTSSPQTVTNLTNGTAYFFKIFTRKGSVWSSGLETSATPVLQSSATDYFRSKQSGDWSANSSWESSSDNATWINATLIPSSSANNILVQSSHTVTITSAVSLDQTTVNGTLLLNSGTNVITVANGSGSDLVVNSGGILEVAGTNITTTVFTGTIFVNGGGIIRYTSGGGTGVSLVLGGTSTNSQIIYGNGGIFEWNSTSPFNSSNVTYFSTSSTGDVPVYRISVAPSNVIGATTSTVFNGVLEANANVFFTASGTKTFRNGIMGSASVTQNSGCGQFIISGTTATFGGTGAISLNTNGMTVNSGTALVLSSNKAINGSVATNTCSVSGSIDCMGFVVSGTGTLAMMNGSTLITSNSNGVSGSIQMTGGSSFDSGTNYTFNGSSDQSTGFGTSISVAASISMANNVRKITLDKDITLNGTVSIPSNVVFYLPSGINITKGTSGLVSLSGVLQTGDADGLLGASNGSLQGFSGNSDVVLGAGSTVEYTGDVQSISPNITYQNISFSGTGPKVFPNVLTIQGNFTNNLSPSTSASSFTYGTSTVSLTGANAQSILGSGRNSFYNLVIDKSSNALTLDAANYMNEVAGVLTIKSGASTALYTNDKLTLVSTSTGTISALYAGSLIDLNNTANSGGSVSGNVVVQRASGNGTVNRAFYMSMPVAGNLDQMQSTSTNFYFFNETKTSGIPSNGSRSLLWEKVTSPSSASNSPGKGLSLRFKTRTTAPKGIVYNGTYNVSVTNSGQFAAATSNGWNLIGNPYPSPLDLDIVGDNSNTSNIAGSAFYIWDGDKYCIWSSLLNEGTNMSSSIIGSMQGFFVRALTGGGNVQFTNSARTSGDSDNKKFYRVSTDELPKIGLSIFDGKNSDEVKFVVYDQSDASGAFDVKTDVLKLISLPAALPYIYAEKSSLPTAIHTIPSMEGMDRIPLHVISVSDSNHTISATKIKNFDSSVTVYLEDKDSGVLQELNSNPTYTTKISKGTNSDRFSLVVRSSVVTHKPIAEKTSLKIYSVNNKLIIDSQLESTAVVDLNVFDVTGKLVFEKNGLEVIQGVSEIDLGQLVQGVYPVHLRLNSKIETGKILLMNY